MTHRPDGQLVKASASSSTVYLVVNNDPPNNKAYKQQFYNSQDRASYNFQQPVCVDAAIGSPTYYPFASPSTIRAREGTAVQDATSIYSVDRDGSIYKVRRFTSMDSLNFYGRAPDVHGWTLSGYSVGSTVHPVKSLFLDRWYKSLVTNSLSFDRGGSGLNASWNTEITSGRDAWNATNTVVNFNEVSWNVDNDVHVLVQPFPGEWAGGWTDLKDANGNFCPGGDCPGGSTWRQAVVYLNSIYSPIAGLAAHELGHSISLAHDGLDPDGGDADDLPDLDGQCGSQGVGARRVPATIMDYDCYATFGLPAPQNWDVCGVNHAYYWSGIGEAGC